jgi:hypothetical protein
MEWGEGIIDGIQRSKLMVLVFSSSANASPQIRREVERAVNKGLPIIPFRIEEVMPSRSLEYFLSSPHWLDALTPPVEAHIQKLVDSVKTLLARTDGAATQTAPPLPPPSRARAKVQKVLDTVLGRPPKVVETGPVPGLAVAPHMARRRVTRPPAPPPSTPRSLMIAVGVLFVIAIAVFLLPRKSAPSPTAMERQPAAPAAQPTPQPTLPPMTGYDPWAAAPSAAAASQAAPAAAAQKAPRVAATYDCRSGVKFSIDPDNATVTLDGRNIGAAETYYHRAYPLRPGTHYAKLTLRGYRPETVKIVVRPGASDENTDVKLKLRPSS